MSLNRKTDGTKKSKGGKYENYWIKGEKKRWVQTNKVTVVGNCCWQVKNRKKRQRKKSQYFSTGTRSKRPNFAHISKARPKEHCEKTKN